MLMNLLALYATARGIKALADDADCAAGDGSLTGHPASVLWTDELGEALGEPRSVEHSARSGGLLAYSVTAAAALALGAGVMYLLDPDRGTTRRKLIRDKAVRATNQTGTRLRRTADYAAGRTRGLVAQTRSRFRAEHPDDRVIRERVRAAMGHAVSHPAAIRVDAHDGVVTLHGLVPVEEEERLLATVHAVRGVRQLESHLQLTGDVYTRLPHGAAHSEWSPAVRLVTGALGAASVLWGVWRRDWLGLVVAIAGGAAMTRSLTNTPAKRLVGLGGSRRGIEVGKSVVINAPLERVFDFFSNYQNFPYFLHNVKEVRDHADGRSHWVVAGPAGLTVSWDADLAEYVPNRTIAWRSVQGSTVDNAGAIEFEPAGAATRVSVRLAYHPPGGSLGHVIAKLLGADPQKELEEDLGGVKSMLESEHHTSVAATPGPAANVTGCGSVTVISAVRESADFPPPPSAMR